jgi:hypothetical protein
MLFCSSFGAAGAGMVLAIGLVLIIRLGWMLGLELVLVLRLGLMLGLGLGL